MLWKSPFQGRLTTTRGEISPPAAAKLQIDYADKNYSVRAIEKYVRPPRPALPAGSWLPATIFY